MTIPFWLVLLLIYVWSGSLVVAWSLGADFVDEGYKFDFVWYLPFAVAGCIILWPGFLSFLIMDNKGRTS